MNLSPIFWKEKYELKWCSPCDVAVIICPECKNSSCSCGSCKKCHADFEEFQECKISVQEYLTEGEKFIYEKAERLKGHILRSLGQGRSNIYWEVDVTKGQFSDNEMKWVKDYL